MFDNPFSEILPNKFWYLLLRYFELRSCFHSGWRPQSKMRLVQYATRKGHLAWREEGPYPAEARGSSSPGDGFGDRDCDEVAACYLGLTIKHRLAIEYSVLGEILDQPTKVMHCLARDLGIAKRSVWRLRQKAFFLLAQACLKKGIVTER